MEELERRRARRGRGRRGRRRRDEDDEDDEDDETRPRPSPRPRTTTRTTSEHVEVAPPDPGARRRYRFKHPTASGKTVAAAGFVDACRTAGVLILTHRRLLVDQFQRDLKEQGYGPRLWAAIDKGRPHPRAAAGHRRDVRLVHQAPPGLSTPTPTRVVLCDEAHTALGERTSASIRKFSKPTYIGMTATDQLLQKHVSDVFPAEIADFPLSDAVRRGVVAPLRCLRVRPGASLRNVPVVGGDFDQGLLAAALDHEALNMAAAAYYADRFGDRAGIIYAAGVDHAENVAQALRAAGVKAKSVSGRTPAARARRDARGLRARRDERARQRPAARRGLERPARDDLHAPRADREPPRLPAARRPRDAPAPPQGGRRRRRLRRSGGAALRSHGDAAQPARRRRLPARRARHAASAAPPAALAQDRRGRSCARSTGSCPVADDPERRRAAIVADWKSVAADMLPPDEQELWAETAARRVAPDRPDAARRRRSRRSPRRRASRSSRPAPPSASTARCGSRRSATSPRATPTRTRSSASCG